jgi:hypothetical protein
VFQINDGCRRDIRYDKDAFNSNTYLSRSTHNAQDLDVTERPVKRKESETSVVADWLQKYQIVYFQL